VNNPVCPICGSDSHRCLRKHGYWIRQCDSCGHQFAELEQRNGHVDRTYGDHYFCGDPAGYPNYLDEGELLLAHGRMYARLMNRYMNPGSLLDVGSAAGFVLKGFEEMGWLAAGIEPNSTMAGHARNHLGLDVETCTLEEFRSSDQYDLICMIQVVAHFVDPRRAFKAAAQITKPGGFWLVETWDRRSRMARFLGKWWHEYSPPSVLHWFSRNGLANLVSEFGFCEVAHGWPRKWIRASHAKAIARDAVAVTPSAGIVKLVGSMIPSRLVVPYVGDDAFWELYRSQ